MPLKDLWPLLELRYSGCADNLRLFDDALIPNGLLARSKMQEEYTSFQPFQGCLLPYWDMRARGCIVGLTRYIEKEHIIRATLECICYQTLDVQKAMEADSGVPLTELKVDGGAVRNNLLMQLQADLLGVPVVRPRVNETTALQLPTQLALLRILDKPDELRHHWKVDKRFEPAMAAETRDEMYRAGKSDRKGQGMDRLI